MKKRRTAWKCRNKSKDHENAEMFKNFMKVEGKRKDRGVIPLHRANFPLHIWRSEGRLGRMLVHSSNAFSSF